LRALGMKQGVLRAGNPMGRGRERQFLSRVGFGPLVTTNFGREKRMSRNPLWETLVPTEVPGKCRGEKIMQFGWCPEGGHRSGRGGEGKTKVSPTKRELDRRKADMQKSWCEECFGFLRK